MESFFGQMYLDLQKRIKSQVPAIKFVEQNFGQYLQEKFRDSVSFPAVLIDFPLTQFSAMSGNLQEGVPGINLLLLFETVNQSYDIAPDAVKVKALDYYEIEHDLHRALQGWCTEYCTPLTRVSVKSQNRHEQGVRIREMDYNTSFEEWPDQEVEKEITFTFTGSIGEEEPG